MVAEKRNGRVGRDLTEGSIEITLITFAAPMILAGVIQQLYGMVDLMVVGHFVGSTGTVGVSTGGELSDLLTPIATSVSAAGQIYIAQLVGAKKEKKAKEAIGTLLSLMMIISVFCLLVGAIFHTPILKALNCPEEAFQEAVSYLVITSIGMPFIFGYNAVCGVLRGMGEAKRPLIFVCVAATVNIFADLIFVIAFGMGAAGTAIATVLSQLGSFVAAYIYMYKRRDQFDFELKLSYFALKKEPLFIIVKLGIPQLIKTMLVHFSMIWVNANINSYGLVVSATNSVGNKIIKFTNAFMNGVDSAGGVMVGQNLGAKKYDRAKKSIIWALIDCMIAAAVFSLLGLLFPREIFGLFTTDQEVLANSVLYMQIMCVTFFVYAFTGSLQAMVTGSGFVTLGSLLGILDGVVCRIGISLLFLNVFEMGYVSYFWGTALSRTIPGLICLWYFLSGKWKTRRLLSEETEKGTKN